MALNLIISPYHPPRFRWTLKGHCRPKVRDYYIFSCQFPQVQFTPAQSCASSKQETDRYSTTSIPRGQTHPEPPEVIHTMKGRMGWGEGGQKAKLQIHVSIRPGTNHYYNCTNPRDLPRLCTNTKIFSTPEKKNPSFTICEQINLAQI